MRIVAWCTCSTCARARFRQRLRERELGVRAAGRRAACAAGARRWRGSAAGCGSRRRPRSSRPLSAPTSGRVSSGAPAASIGRRSRGGARLDLLRQARERPQAALHAEPDDEQRGDGDQQLGQDARAAGCSRARRSRLTMVSATSTVQVERAARRLHRDHAHLWRRCSSCRSATASLRRRGQARHRPRFAWPAGPPRGSRSCRSGRCAGPARPPPAARSGIRSASRDVHAERRGRCRPAPGRRRASRARWWGSSATSAPSASSAAIGGSSMRSRWARRLLPAICLLPYLYSSSM